MRTAGWPGQQKPLRDWPTSLSCQTIPCRPADWKHRHRLDGLAGQFGLPRKTLKDRSDA